MQLAPLDGLQTLRVIRTMKPNLPCILVSRRTTNRDLRQALSLHAFSVLDEPFGRDLLAAQLNRVFAKFYDGALF